MGRKRRLVAYCPECLVRGRNTLLAEMYGDEPGNDFLCVFHWIKYTTLQARLFAERQGGQYRGKDKNPANRKREYIAKDGFRTTDGRVFAKHVRETGANLKNVRSPL